MVLGTGQETSRECFEGKPFSKFTVQGLAGKRARDLARSPGLSNDQTILPDSTTHYGIITMTQRSSAAVTSTVLPELRGGDRKCIGSFRIYFLGT